VAIRETADARCQHGRAPHWEKFLGFLPFYVYQSFLDREVHGTVGLMGPRGDPPRRRRHATRQGPAAGERG